MLSPVCAPVGWPAHSALNRGHLIEQLWQMAIVGGRYLICHASMASNAAVKARRPSSLKDVILPMSTIFMICSFPKTEELITKPASRYSPRQPRSRARRAGLARATSVSSEMLGADGAQPVRRGTRSRALRRPCQRFCRRISSDLWCRYLPGTKSSDALPCCDQADCNSRRLRNGRTGWRFSAGHIIAQ